MNRWAIVGRPDGTLFADILREAGGLVADVFPQATLRFNHPVNFKRHRHWRELLDWDGRGG